MPIDWIDVGHETRGREGALRSRTRPQLDERTFERELRKLQRELVIMQEYVKARA